MNTFFQKYNRTDVDLLVRCRTGETKLGQVIDVPGEEPLQAFLERTAATFAVVGIAEDIGVLANYGRPGAASVWNSFLSSFLNIQANGFTRPENIAVVGCFSFDTLKEEIEKKVGDPEDRIIEFRKAVSAIDDVVSELIRLMVSHEKTPIVVGGGHNNSYPLIKGTALALRSRDVSNPKGINCINLDAHIDYRLPEGRHSGNGFRYAKQEGFLEKYLALAVHENYIPENILKEITRMEDIDMVTYEDIFIKEKKTWSECLKDGARFTRQLATGVELDVDGISNIPSSAATPGGVSVREALQYVDYLASHSHIAYLHICEGIASSDNGVGKLISSIVSQFIKSSPLKSGL